MSLMESIADARTTAVQNSARSTAAPEKSVPAGPKPQDDNPRQDELDSILDDYQVADDEMVTWTPNLGPYPVDIPFAPSKEMTATEGELAFSDQVPVGQTGSADDPPRDSGNHPPDYDPGS